jgi:hypothetical protein
MYQGALWGWGGTLVIPTIDFYFIPEILWQGCDCNLPLSIDYIPIKSENSDVNDGNHHNGEVDSYNDKNYDDKDSPMKKTIIDEKNSRETNSKDNKHKYSTASNDDESFNIRKRLNSVKPQVLFSEQIVFFSGIPQLPIAPSIEINELWKTLQSRYLFPPQNTTHIYIFPGTIRHLHPEFDSALSILLKTDPMVMVVLAGNVSYGCIHTWTRTYMYILVYI